MVEVVKSNFNQLLPKIQESIKNALFISFDTEFTGLTISPSNKSSLFDSLDDRYEKLKQSASSFTICQLGLTTFSRAKTENVYSAETYIFYLRPYQLGSTDRCFMFQASCIDFLTAYDFDFNKCMYEGIPYLNETEEVKAKKEISDGTLHLHHMESFGRGNRKENHAIMDWLFKADEGDELSLSLEKGVHEYFQLCSLRFNYPSLWAYVKDGKIILRKVSAKQKEEYLKTLPVEQQCVFEHYVGFAEVFKSLKEHKKVLVGHNMLLDLLLFFQNFYRPLPETFQEFKYSLNSLFPVIFDTKYIWLNVKQFCDVGRISHGSGLYEIYELLKSPPDNLVVLFTPGVEHKNSSNYCTQFLPHDAGFDSFLCGWVFVKVSHMLAIKRTKSLAQIVPQTWNQHLKAVKPFENKVNISRARVRYIDLAGEDSPTHRPDFLYVKLRNWKSILKPLEVEKKLGMYGFVEVRQISLSEALVAVASFGCANDILRDLQNDPHFYVDRYSTWRHWWLARAAMWMTCGASACFSLFLAFKLLQQHR